jgi:hypothetical protein
LIIATWLLVEGIARAMDLVCDVRRRWRRWALPYVGFRAFVIIAPMLI